MNLPRTLSLDQEDKVEFLGPLSWTRRIKWTSRDHAPGPGGGSSFSTVPLTEDAMDDTVSQELVYQKVKVKKIYQGISRLFLKL